MIVYISMYKYNIYHPVDILLHLGSYKQNNQSIDDTCGHGPRHTIIYPNNKRAKILRLYPNKTKIETQVS